MKQDKKYILLIGSLEIHCVLDPYEVEEHGKYSFFLDDDNEKIPTRIQVRFCKKYKKIIVTECAKNGSVFNYTLFECAVFYEEEFDKIRIIYKTKLCGVVAESLSCSFIVINLENSSGFQSTDVIPVGKEELQKLRNKALEDKAVESSNKYINAFASKTPFVLRDNDFDIAITFSAAQVHLVVRHELKQEYDQFEKIYINILEFFNVIIGETLKTQQILFEGDYVLIRKLLPRFSYKPHLKLKGNSFVDLSSITDIQSVYNKFCEINNEANLTLDLFFTTQAEEAYSEQKLANALRVLEGLSNYDNHIKKENKQNLIKQERRQQKKLDDSIADTILDFAHKAIYNSDIDSNKFVAYLSERLYSYDENYSQGNRIEFKVAIYDCIRDYGADVFFHERETGILNRIINDFANLRDNFSHGYTFNSYKVIGKKDYDYAYYHLIIILMLKIKLIKQIGLSEDISVVKKYVEETREMFTWGYI